ncbi:MAG: glycosyltransferase [Solirubrobacteraceae bacterium]
MRVLTVGNLYPPHHFGGYEQVWKSAVGHLRERGHEVRVLATGYRHGGIADGDEPDVYRTLRWYWASHEFAQVPLRERLQIERHNHRELNRQLSELRPDVVSFWSMGGMSHSLIEAARRRKLPVVAFVHDQWLDYGRATDQWLRLFYPRRRRPLARLLQPLTRVPTRVNYGAAGRYVFVSEFIRRRALELPIALPDTAVAHSGIDPRFLHRSPDHEWRWRLLHVGRLHPDKGIFEAVAALRHMPPEATLSFAGSWNARDESKLADLVSQLGLQARVKMLGHLPPGEVAELYGQHDALLFPVRWDEPWGLVPLEAMASGCPVLATGRGGSAEYLCDEENCLLVRSGDVAALAAAARRLAGEPELRGKLRAAGAETAARHTAPAFNTEVERHLTELAGRRPGGRSPTPR